jgi:hypothetical protein
MHILHLCTHCAYWAQFTPTVHTQSILCTLSAHCAHSVHTVHTVHTRCTPCAHYALQMYSSHLMNQAWPHRFLYILAMQLALNNREENLEKHSHVWSDPGRPSASVHSVHSVHMVCTVCTRCAQTGSLMSNPNSAMAQIPVALPSSSSFPPSVYLFAGFLYRLLNFLFTFLALNDSEGLPHGANGWLFFAELQGWGDFCIFLLLFFWNYSGLPFWVRLCSAGKSNEKHIKQSK